MWRRPPRDIADANDIYYRVYHPTPTPEKVELPDYRHWFIKILDWFIEKYYSYQQWKLDKLCKLVDWIEKKINKKS